MWNAGDIWVWALGAAEIAVNSDNAEITREGSVTAEGPGQGTLYSECAAVTLDTSELDSGC